MKDKNLEATYAILKKADAMHPSVTGTLERLVHDWTQAKTTHLPKLLEGVDFAVAKHHGQVRNHAESVPYVVHPLRVALLLWEEAGIHDEDLLLAALLHDTLEDTATTPEEIGAKFGPRVQKLVQELTEKPNATGEDEVKSAKAMSKEAKTIKLGDRTHNLRDLIDHPPKVWHTDKVHRFLDRSADLLIALQGVNPVLEKAYREAMRKVTEFDPTSSSNPIPL